MSRPRPGVHSAGLKIDPDVASVLEIESIRSTPPVKRQRVEVVLDVNARTPTPAPTRLPIRAVRASTRRSSAAATSTTRVTALRPSSSSQKVKYEDDCSSDEDVDELAPRPFGSNTPAFDMNAWKDELRRLYSAECSLPEKEVSAQLEVLFARLPDEPTKKLAIEYLGVLRDAVQESVQADYEHARKRRKTFESELKSTRAQLEKLQSRAAAVDEKFIRAERDNEAKNEKLARVKSISAMVEGLVGSVTSRTDDVAAGEEPLSEPEEAHLNVDGDPGPVPEAFITFYGSAKEVQKKYNGILLTGDGTRSPRKRHWKVWPLHVPGAERDWENGIGRARPSFCSAPDVMEAPPHLMCTKCKEGPRVLLSQKSHSAEHRR